MVLCLLGIIGMLSAGCQSAATVSGKVVKVSDGDTFHLLTAGNRQVKVRLYGVDAPEKGQAFGSRAQQTLSQLVFGRQVTVNSKGTDQFKRVLGIVVVQNDAGSTIVVNEALLQQGMAWHFTRYDKNPDWARLQQQAKANKTGLWADSNPTPPWEWRKNR